MLLIRCVKNCVNQIRQVFSPLKQVERILLKNAVMSVIRQLSLIAIAATVFLIVVSTKIVTTLNWCNCGGLGNDCGSCDCGGCDCGGCWSHASLYSICIIRIQFCKITRFSNVKNFKFHSLKSIISFYQSVMLKNSIMQKVHNNKMFFLNSTLLMHYCLHLYCSPGWQQHHFYVLPICLQWFFS